MGCLSCCKKDEDATGPNMSNRSCTDCLCLLFFLGTWVGLIIVLALGVQSGDLDQLKYASDYLGNRCGVKEKADYPKAFYPRMGDDIVAQKDNMATGAWWSLKLYTLCVAECPEGFSLEDPVLIKDENYEASAANQAVAYNGVISRAEWPSVLPTQDLMNRCIPRMQSTEEESRSCIYPNCTAPELAGLDVVCNAANDGSWKPCADGSFECQAAAAACVVDKVDVSGTVFQPSGNNEAAEEIMDMLSNAANDAYEMASSTFNNLRWVMVGGVVLPVALMCGYMLLLRWLAGFAMCGAPARPLGPGVCAASS
jgi:choline transporter-like protein 2/4/5